MNTQMNPTDAEIAGIVRKLNGMKYGGAGITNQVLGFLSIYLLNRPMDHVTLGPKDLLTFCRAVVERVDGPAKPINIERIIYALQLWMKRIVMGIPVHSQEGWEVRWERLEKVIEDWKTKGEMPT